jgi:hypothetical protein
MMLMPSAVIPAKAGIHGFDRSSNMHTCIQTALVDPGLRRGDETRFSRFSAR